MHAMTITGRTDKRGILNLAVPVGLPETTIEVVVVVPITPANPESRGWPPGFFERTAGRWQGDLARPDQGDYEIREEMK